MVSNIKKNENIKREKPDNIEEILIEFNPNKYTEEEKNRGCIVYIMRHFIDKGILKMTITDLANETERFYHINRQAISDIKRSTIDIKPFKPDREVLGILFEKYYFPEL